MKNLLIKFINTTFGAWFVIIVGLIIGISLIAFIGNLPKLIATDWDFRCIFVECRIMK